MNATSDIIIKRSDLEKILAILPIAQRKIAELLEEELTRANIVSDEHLPKDIVSMNVEVTYKDLETEKESVITLVYPHEANIDQGKISILTPVGSALIGLRVGQSISWPFPQGKRKELRVLAVA